MSLRRYNGRAAIRAAETGPVPGPMPLVDRPWTLDVFEGKEAARARPVATDRKDRTGAPPARYAARGTPSRVAGGLLAT